MYKKEFSFSFEVYDSISELDNQDAELLKKAREITHQAYAPYSNFNVGAAARLNNGAIVMGTNQENASFPVGICAERGLLSTIVSLHPEVPVQAMAISYHNKNGESSNPISPCGMCRQALLEFEGRTHQSIKIILGGQNGQIYVIEKVSNLLPLSFTAKDLLTGS